MKHIIAKSTLMAVAFLFILTTNKCTDNFEEINSHPYGATGKQLAQDWKNIGGNFLTMQRGIVHWTHWKYQLQQNLNGDVYAQYLIPPTPFGGNVNNVTYGFNEGWNLWPWLLAFEDVMVPALLVENITKDDESMQHFTAWAALLKVYAMHRLSDIHGPIVYSKFGTVDVNIPYDSQKDAYYLFFKDLSDAVNVLTPFADADNQSFKNFDLAYSGNMKKWIKAANSLRLRLAIRIAQIEPAKAKTEFEAAINHKYGVFESNDDNFFVNLPESHPIKTISVDWADSRMSATMESYLKGYNDSRMSAYFSPASISKEFHGIRQGVEISSKSEYENEASAVGSWFASNSKIQVMTYSEVCFLKSEAKLRGWNIGSGSAQEHYENGIKASFALWGAPGVDTYLTNNISTPQAYVDPIGKSVNNVSVGSGLLSNATIQWNEAISNDEKLEKIITQKWLALFPDGQEAWSEFRRTGYPKLFPLVVNLSGGAIPSGQFVKRLKFSSDEYSKNATEVQKAVTLIGGIDGYNVRLWWDVAGDAPENNF